MFLFIFSYRGKKRLAAVSGYQIRSDPILSLSSLHAIKEIIINAEKGGHVNSLQSICHAGGQYGANVKFKRSRQNSLGRRVLDKLDTLADVTAQTLITLDQELLLVVVGAGNDIDGLLGSLGAELDRDGEEIAAGFLLDGVTAVDAGEVDECGFGDAGLALDCLEELFGETESGVGHGEGCGAGAVLGLDDLVTTELDACGKESVGGRWERSRKNTHGWSGHRACPRER